MDMRRYLSEKLSLIPELGEREIMRKTMEQVFLPLYDHMMEKYDGLERRIYEKCPSCQGYIQSALHCSHIKTLEIIRGWFRWTGQIWNRDRKAGELLWKC